MGLGQFFKDNGLDILSLGLAAIPGGGIAREIAAEIAGKPKTANDAEIEAALRADPDKLIELKKAEQANETAIIQAYLADRQSARQMRIAMKSDDRITEILAYAAMGGLLAVVVMLIFADIPESSARDALLVLLGSLATIAKDVYGFFFGSSRGSKEKTAVMANGKK